MKVTSILLIGSVIIASCSLFERPSITKFPTKLQFDSLIIVSMHVYDTLGELDTVDSKLVDFSSLKTKDSIIILDTNHAVLYSHMNSRRAVNKDSSQFIDKLNIKIACDSFVTTMVNPPDIFILPDTDEPEQNAHIITNRFFIKKANTKVYYKSKKKFYLEQYGVKLMSINKDNPKQYSGYTLGSLNRINSNRLRKYLENNEYLTVIHYVEVFSVDN